MSNYLRDVLGAGNSSSAQPQGLVADSGPDIPGGEGANKGFWRKQLKDRLMRFAKMYGSVLFDVEIENIGRVAGHGQIIDAVAPNIALIRIKNHPILGDMDLPVPSTQFEVVDAVIPDADYKRISRNNPNLKQKKPKLKDFVSGDEVLSTIRSAVARDLKEKGRFPVIRSAKDLEEVVSAQYKSLFSQIKEENPELLKVFGNMEIPNEDLFWDYIKANYATDLMTMYVSPDQIPPLNKLVNQLYAEKFLGVKKDGLISFYRNNIRSKPNESEAAAGYASLDKYMAFDYNVAMGKNDGGEFVGRYEVKAKPDEVSGLLGYSRIEDEIGVVISPEVTSIPGRVTKLGDVEIPNPDNAPWFDLENLDFNRGTGGSPFRHLTPLGQFDYYALDSNPFGDGKGWSAFYAANGLETGAIPNKYDELYGEGAWERDWSEEKPQATMYNAMFKEFTDEDGNKKWGLKGESIHNLAFGTEKYFNDPKAGDEFDRAIKVLSVMQELMGKPFFVNRGHDPNDPRLKDVEKQDVLRPASIEDLGIDFQTATMDASGTRLPTPGAFTGKFQDIMAGAQSWKEVQDRLAGQTITYFDFETTGISDYDGDGIKNDPLQLGAVQVKDGKIIKRFNLYVNPESKLSYWSATKLKRDVVDENGNKVLDEKGNPTYTQLTPEWIKEQASPDDAIRQFVEFIGPDALVGGQNVPFDMEILKRMADSAGIELDISGTIDSKDLASLLPKYDPEKGIDGPKQLEDEKTGKMRPSSSLGPVANFLGFEPANWHSADGDAEDSYNLVSKIIDRAAKEDNKDLRLLDFDLQKKQYKERMDEFKKVVSKDNPITQRQLDALEEFSKSDSEEIASSAKKALAEAKTRGEAAQALEAINALNDAAKPELVAQEEAAVLTMEDLPASKIYSEDRYTPVTEIGIEIKGEDLESDEFEAIENYMGSDYTEINAALLANPSMSGEEMVKSVDPSTIEATSVWGGEVYKLEDTRAFELISLLDSAFAKSSLKNDAVLYRGLHLSVEQRDALLSLKPGGILTDSRFMSATTSLQVANEYATRTNGAGGYDSPTEGHVPVLYRIKASKGTPAFYSEDIVASYSIDHLVIARNLPLTIENISKTNKGVLVIDLKTPEAEDMKNWNPTGEAAEVLEKLNATNDGPKIEPQELTEAEKMALEFYSGSLSREVNKYLKEGREGITNINPFTSVPDNVDLVVNTAEKIKKAFEKSSLSEDTPLSRLVPRYVGENIKPGDILDSSTFLSTTKNPRESGTKNMFHRSVLQGLSRESGEIYGNRNPAEVGWTVYEIEAPKGTKAIDLAGIGLIDEEAEVLLPANTRLEVVSVEDRPEPDFPQRDGSIFKAYTVKLRIVEDTPKPAEQEERKTGLFNEYESERADQITAEDTPLTDLGWEPWEEITIYRGVPDDVDSINPGDWVTTLPQLAKDYAGANGKVISTKVKASELLADPSSGEGAYTEEMVWRPKAKPEKTSEPRSEIASIDMSGTRLSSEVKEELNSLISSFNLANTEAKSKAYREIAAELGRPVSLPWDKDRTPEGRETYDYIDSAERFKKATAETDEEKELLRIKNLFEEKVANNKDLQEAREALYSNKIYKDVVDALSSEINDFDEDNIDFGLMDVGRNLSRPRPRLSDDEIEEFLIESPDYADEEVNELTYDVTVDIDQSVEITNKDLKEFSETAAVSIILPSRALEEVLNEGRMKTVHETKYSQAGNSSEEYRALRVAYESLAFGYGGDSPMEERPVYGLLRSATLPMPEDALMIYGGGKPAQIFLKPEVKDRTTISDRDSLNFFESTTSLTDPKFEASHLTRMAAVYREATGDNFFETENFAKFGSIEAQIHGGVKLEDIGKVVFYETPSEELRELLTSKGIIWEVSRNKPYSKPRTFGGGIF